MNRGDGRRITTDVGSITTTTGPGVRAVSTIDTAVGGARLWSRLASLSETTSAGIRCRITSAIHIRVTIVTTIVTGITIRDRGMVAADETIDTAMTKHGEA